MGQFVPWNSQPLAEWARDHAEGHFIELDGHSTHYIVKGDGEPVILLHGFFYDAHMWDNNIDVFAAKYRVYALDLWGFGYSTREPLDYGYPLYTRQLLSFMDALDIQRASLIGQSMGGGTIINYTISHPERVHKVILVDPAGMPSRLPIMGRIANLPGVGEFMYGVNNDFVRKTTLRTSFIHNEEHVTDSYFAKVTRFHKIRGTTEVMLSVLRKQFFDTLLNEMHTLGTMEVPVLIVWGRNDKSIPVGLGREMHRILKGSRLEILDHAGHCPHDEQSEQFNQLALDFLA